VLDLVKPIRASGGFLAGDGRHGSTKPIPADSAADARTNMKGCGSDYFTRASRNFFACGVFLAFQEWRNGEAACQNQGK
jgi:hypothetical protein